MSVAAMRARLDRLGQRRTFRAVRDDAIERFLDERQARKSPMPTIDLDALAAILGPSGALVGVDRDADDPDAGPKHTDLALTGETIADLQAMADPDDPLRSDDPGYPLARLRRMTAFTLASRPLLRTIAHERGLTDAGGRAIGADDDAEPSRWPDTPTRTPVRWPDDQSDTNPWRFNDGR